MELSQVDMSMSHGFSLKMAQILWNPPGPCPSRVRRELSDDNHVIVPKSHNCGNSGNTVSHCTRILSYCTRRLSYCTRIATRSHSMWRAVSLGLLYYIYHQVSHQDGRSDSFNWIILHSKFYFSTNWQLWVRKSHCNNIQLLLQLAKEVRTSIQLIAYAIGILSPYDTSNLTLQHALQNRSIFNYQA